jgi:DNA-directed RNA polymerase specialized sigma24 family protein
MPSAAAPQRIPDETTAPAPARCDVSLAALRSLDSATNRDAWNTAYPWLWSAGTRLASRLLSGSEWEQQREDATAIAIAQVVHGIVEGTSDVFNQIDTFDDLLSMTLTIVRRRITDFHRSRSRSREDAVDELPEIIGADTPVTARFSAAELRDQISALDPPNPALFMDRFFGGMTTREVAAKHAMPHGTVLTHFAQGLRLLRDRLSQLDL